MAIIAKNGDLSAELEQSFTQWLRERAGLPDARLDFFGQASSGSGWSNETLRATIRRTADAQPEDVIIRLPPAGEALFRDYDITRQYNTMKALGGAPGLPLPACLWLETDAGPLGRPFYVMERINGHIPEDKPLYMTEGWVVDATDAERRTLWTSAIEAIANLSRVDWAARGLRIYDWPDRNRSAVAQHLEMWEGIYDWGASLMPPDPDPLADEVRHWLHRNMPREETRGFLWGDSRLGNFIFRDFRPVGLLDWEISVVGDPECDFAYYLMVNRHLELMAAGGDPATPRLGGFLSDDDSIAHYEAYLGKSMRNYAYYWMFNAFKVYAIRQRIAGLGVKSDTMTIEEGMRMRKLPTLANEISSRL